MIKPLLLTMTQNREKDISLMVKNIYPTFDGIVGLVNQPSWDTTYHILNQNKGNGKILKANWTPNHGFLMNHLLFYGGIKEGTYCFFLDSPESMTDEFIRIIPGLLEEFEEKNVSALYWNERPYIFKYNQYMEFHGAYHWGLQGLRGNIVTLPDKDKYIINRRNENPEISYCFNPIKSYLCYPLSNETTIMYSKYGSEILNKEENKRREIRKYLQEVLKLDLTTLDDLISYLTKIKDGVIVPDSYFIEAMDSEFRLSELFQLKVLGMKFMEEIVPRRYKFSFKDYLEKGDGFINPNYFSTILKYDSKDWT